MSLFISSRKHEALRQVPGIASRMRESVPRSRPTNPTQVPAYARRWRLGGWDDRQDADREGRATIWLNVSVRLPPRRARVLPSKPRARHKPQLAWRAVGSGLVSARPGGPDHSWQGGRDRHRWVALIPQPSTDWHCGSSDARSWRGCGGTSGMPRRSPVRRLDVCLCGPVSPRGWVGKAARSARPNRIMYWWRGAERSALARPYDSRPAECRQCL
jgi:hypothetical protein